MDKLDFEKAYDLVTIGMRLAYMDGAGIISIDPTVFGEEELTDFALELSKGFPDYMESDPEGSWDEYIETKIIEKYGMNMG